MDDNTEALQTVGIIQNAPLKLSDGEKLNLPELLPTFENTAIDEEKILNFQPRIINKRKNSVYKIENISLVGQPQIDFKLENTTQIS